MDLETQEQPTVIGGCFNGRYRDGEFGFIRMSGDSSIVGEFHFRSSDPIFQHKSPYIRDLSPARNDLWWVSLGEWPIFLPVENPDALSASSSLKQASSPASAPSNCVVISALLAGGGGTGYPRDDDLDDPFALPFYFLALASDCRRLQLRCVVLYHVDVISDRLAHLYQDSAFFEMRKIPRIVKRETAVRARINGILSYVADHPTISHLLHLDLRDSRINRDPFPYIINNNCTLFFQTIRNGIMLCGGFQAGRRPEFLELFTLLRN